MLISPFTLLNDQFSTWSEFETSGSKTLKVGKCTKTVRSGCIHNSNLSEKRHKVLMHNSRPIQVRNFYQNNPKLKCPGSQFSTIGVIYLESISSFKSNF